MFDDDDFDPSFHTSEEIAAQRGEEAAFQASLGEQLLELDDDLDDYQGALDLLAETDPMGFVISGQAHEGRTVEQAAEWLEARLHGKPL